MKSRSISIILPKTFITGNPSLRTLLSLGSAGWLKPLRPDLNMPGIFSGLLLLLKIKLVLSLDDRIFPAVTQQVVKVSTVWVLLLSVGCAGSLQERPDFLERTISIGQTTYRYQVFLPLGWRRGEVWPVILFLHGNGERGNDGLRQTRVGIGPVIRRNPEKVPAIVLLPQCRKGMWWTHREMETLALSILEVSLQEFNGDPARTSLTGISMGGYGTWNLAARYPGKFVALAPICGGVLPPPGVRIPEGHPPVEFSVAPYREMAKRIGDTPVWIFHGTDDQRVPVSESRKMAEAIQLAGGGVRYSEYAGIGHNSWENAYDEPDFFQWILSH